MDGRFSKKQMATWLGKSTLWMEQEYGFHDRTGCAQVRGKGEDLNRAFGEYTQLRNLMDVFDLDWQHFWDGRKEVQS